MPKQQDVPQLTPVLNGLFQHLTLLIDFPVVDGKPKVRGCDGTLQETKAFCDIFGVSFQETSLWPVVDGVPLDGAGCDCEVLLNGTEPFMNQTVTDWSEWDPTPEQVSAAVARIESRGGPHGGRAE